MKRIILLLLVFISLSLGATKNRESILVVDQFEPDFKNQVLRFRVDVYKDPQSRTNGSKSFTRVFEIDKATFQASFDMTRTVIQLRGDLEDYALTLEENGSRKKRN
jgi:hypothetical protein